MSAMTMPTMMNPRNILEQLRAGKRDILPTHSTAVTEALLADLQPGDHALAIWLLEREIAAVAAGTGSPETLYHLVAAVARFAHAEDALLIWRASRANDETRNGVDVEQTLRAGPDTAIRMLRQMIVPGDPRAHEASQALAWIRQGIAEGAANDLPAYFAWSDERFGLHIACATCTFSRQALCDGADNI